MKTAGGALVTFLASATQIYCADLWTITLKAGTVLRYTNAPEALVVSSNTFSPAVIRRDRVRLKLGLEVDTLSMTWDYDLTAITSGLALGALINVGAFDGATVKLERLFMQTSGDVSLGAVHWFEGRVADAEAAGGEAVLKIKSDLEILDIKMPRNLFQAGCINTIYDTACGLNKATYTKTSHVHAGSTASVINCPLADADDYFNLGGITFTSGANSGLTRLVKDYAVGVITCLAFPSIPAVDDTFSIWPGCDKTKTLCNSRYSNSANFRGFPYVPKPETAF